MKKAAADIAAWRRRTREREDAKIAIEQARLQGLGLGAKLETAPKAAPTDHSQRWEVR